VVTRQESYELLGADGSKTAYSVKAHSDDIADSPGVYFLIHVIVRETVTVTTKVPGIDPATKQPGMVTKSEEKTFLRPVLLADRLYKENLRGIHPTKHPDQLYLDTVPEKTLTEVKGKTIVRVEIDDSIELCDTDKFNSCSVKIPAWCQEHFPDVPVYLFVHRSDRKPVEKRQVYDLRPGKEDCYEGWKWGTSGPPDSLFLNASKAAVEKYVIEVRCESTKCGPKKSRKNCLVAVDSATVGAKKQAEAAAAKKCPVCSTAAWQIMTTAPRLKSALESAL